MKQLTKIRREDHYETRWIVVGELGAIDFHCTNEGTEIARQFGRSGGVEYHSKQPFDYDPDSEPSHEHCWLVGRCWHDGTSLWASEHWIPLLQLSGEEAIWRELEMTYRSRFHESAPAVDAVARTDGDSTV